MVRFTVILAFVITCTSVFSLIVAEERTASSSSKKSGLLNRLLQRRRSQATTAGAAAKGSVSSGNTNSMARQEEFQDYGYETYNTYDPSPSTSLSISNKEDPTERVGVITGKKILKIIGITLLALVGIPLILGIPLFPILLIILVLFKLPVVKVIDIPQIEGWLNNNNNNVRSLATFEETCIEKISCNIAKRSGSYGKSMLNWLQTRFTRSPIVKRISRGFGHVEGCETYVCSNPLLERIL